MTRETEPSQGGGIHELYGNNYHGNYLSYHLIYLLDREEEIMNGDLISREALKKEIKKSVPYVEQERILDLIDNVPTIAEDYDTGYQDGLEDGLNDIRPQGEWIAIEPNK